MNVCMYVCIQKNDVNEIMIEVDLIPAAVFSEVDELVRSYLPDVRHHPHPHQSNSDNKGIITYAFNFI